MDFAPLIEKALGELSMIIDIDANEEAFQKWFESNGIVFKCLGYTRVIPHPELHSDGELHVPDFMATSSSGIWEIIELKTANAKISKSTGDNALRANTGDNSFQCIRYIELFKDPACRKRFNEQYSADCHKSPIATLIIGRNEGENKHKILDSISHLHPRPNLLTYDDVRDRIYQLIETAHKFPKEESPGLCVIFSAILLPCLEESYIIDICKKGSSGRIQMYVKDDQINLDVTDKNGKTYSGRTSTDDCRSLFNNFATFAIQISNGSEYSSIELLIGDKLMLEIRQRSLDFDFTAPLDHVVGSDQTGTFPSNIFFGGVIIIPGTLLIEERWLIREYLASMTNEQGDKFLLEFIGHKFLHTPSHPLLGGETPFSNCLMQEDESKKPILRARRAPSE